MFITIHDGVRWVQGRMNRIAGETCEIEASGRLEGQPFGSNAVLLLNAVDDREQNAVSARACLVRAFQREGTWRFVCRITPEQARALEQVLTA